MDKLSCKRYDMTNEEWDVIKRTLAWLRREASKDSKKQ